MSSGKTDSAIAKKATSVPSGSSSGSSKRTTTLAARTAAKVLASPTSDKSAKSLAASFLSQKKPPFPVKAYRVVGSNLTQRQSAAVVREVAAKKGK